MKTGRILTANRVIDGLVVFFSAEHNWVVDISGALVAEDPQALEWLEEHLVSSNAGTEVTDAYLFDAERVAGVIRPIHIRERIRTLGPSVRTDLGKQAADPEGLNDHV